MILLGCILCAYFLIGIKISNAMEYQRILPYILICLFWPIPILYGIITDLYDAL